MYPAVAVDHQPELALDPAGLGHKLIIISEARLQQQKAAVSAFLFCSSVLCPFQHCEGHPERLEDLRIPSDQAALPVLRGARARTAFFTFPFAHLF